MKEDKKAQKTEEDPFIQIDFDEATPILDGLANSYGLDLSDPNVISDTYGNILIEVIGGVEDSSFKHLRVTLKIKKKSNDAPQDIYRSSQVDLFNEGQVEKTIREASERTKVETSKLTDALYQLIEKLEKYRREQGNHHSSPPHVYTTIPVVTKALKSYLKQDDLLNQIKADLQRAGVVDNELGLQLFILGLSRLTTKPLHVIVQGKLLQANELFKAFHQIIPEEQLKEVTSITKKALSYTIYPDQYNGKTLLLHDLQGLFKKESTLQEYITQGKINRIVTEVDRHKGHYKSDEKQVLDCFQIMGYTSIDFHSIFNASSMVVLPQRTSKTLTEELYVREIRAFSGQLETEVEQESIQLLKDIQRYLVPHHIINPYLDQVDLQGFFGRDIKRLRQFLTITGLITFLHQAQLQLHKQKERTYLEVEPDHMIQALQLFECLWLHPEEQLYFSVSGTFNRIKKELVRKYGEACEQKTFKLNDIKPKHIAFSTFSKHARILEDYHKIKRVEGNNRNGYEFQVINWEEEGEKVKQYEMLLKELQDLRN